MKENKTIKSVGRAEKMRTRNQRSEQFAIESLLSTFQSLTFDIYNNMQLNAAKFYVGSIWI